MDDFERILPPELVSSATRSGTELVFPYREAEKAIRHATANLIAILGVEVFRILENADLQVDNYSGYGFEYRGDWTDYVVQNNEAAGRFVADNARGAGYGYIQTASSRNEFARLKSHLEYLE